MAHPLDDPRAKIRRAEEHLRQLEVEWQAWIESHPYLVLPYSNSKKTEWKFLVHRFDEEVKPESDVFGLAIGDYVHNLRSALDHLVWQLVTVANGLTPKSDHDVSFPVVTTHPKDFWARPMITREELTFEQALFLEGFQPYRTLNAPDRSPLAHLHALWNTDKHRLVTAVVVKLAEQGPVFRPNADAGNIVTQNWDGEVPLVGDTEVAWVTVAPVGPDPKVDVESLPVEVFFGEAQRPLKSLPAMGELSRDIIENCARFFP